MDAEAQSIVDEDWCHRLGLPVKALRDGRTHVVAHGYGMNDAMSFRFGDTCVVAVRPDLLAAAEVAISGRTPDEVFTAKFLARLVGPGTRVDGPSWHGYVTDRTFRGVPDRAVTRTAGEDSALLDFLRTSDRAEWGESGFPAAPAAADPESTAFYDLFESSRIVAAGNMTEWRGLPADVGVLTHPSARGRGLASRVVSTMVADALPSVRVVRYRALFTNTPSMAVARRLGFEGYGANFRARRAEVGEPIQESGRH